MTRSLLVRFGIPLASTFLAALLTAWLQPFLTPGRFFLFLTAVVVSAWYGGWRGGLLSTVLGALGHAYLLLRPATAPETVGPGGWLNAALFLPVALLMCWLIGALHAARRKAQSLAATLRQRVLELAEADRCKEEFLAVLGHELRNPLATIVHALHVLRFRDDPPTVQWARGVVERQANHLSRLIDDLLDRTRVSRGKIVLRRERLDLTRFLRAALDDHALDLEAAGVLLRRDLPEGPVWAEGDPTRLAQVVGNLLQNAAKFTDAGGEVAVRLARDAADRRAVVTVRDTGIGIEAEMLPRVFETYAQEERGRGRGRGGLGLGLALVKALVELHGGEVNAASDGPGHGAEFAFWLPLAVRPAPPAAEAAPGRSPRRRHRILLIEDNRDAAESLRVLLGLFGHEVAVAGSGAAGVTLARRMQPDVVVCDLGLPDMDGCAVARALRQDPAAGGARLLALSGRAGDDDRRRSLEAGFDLHLTKPVDVNEIERLLEAVPPRAPETGCRTGPPGLDGPAAAAAG